jgi:tetratricopeptide (TPR) repeat protein
LAVRIPKYNYKKVTFFENGKRVGELKPSERQWSVPAMLTEQDKLAGYTDSGGKNDETAKDLLSRAVAMAEEITDLKEKWLALDQIAGMCEEIGQSDVVLKYRLSALEAKVQFIQKEKFAFYDEKILALANVAVKFSEAGQKERAVKLLTDAYQMAENIKDGARRVYTFVQLADRYTKAGEKDKAVEILSQMLIEVKSLKYNYAKDPDLMRWGPVTVMPSLPFLKKNKVEESVKDIIRAEIAINLAGAGYYERGLEIANSIKDVFVKTGIVEDIAYLYLHNGQYEQSLHVIESISNQTHKNDALSHIAYKFADANQYGYAVQAAKMITYKPLEHSVLTNICNRQAAAGQYDEAGKTLSETLQIAKSMKGAGIDSADVLLKEADMYISLGQKEETIKILSQAFQIVKSTGGDFEKGSRFKEIARDSLKVGYYDLAFQVVEALKDEHLASTILGEIGVAYAQAGQIDKAKQVLSQALQKAQAVEDKSWREVTYREIAVRYSEIGQYEQAIETANLAKEFIVNKNEALEKIAVRMAKDGHLEKAIQLAEDIKGYQRSSALDTIARYLVEAGDYDMAFNAFKGMEEFYLAKEVADILIEKYAQAGQYDRVIEVSKSLQYGRDLTAYSQIAINCARTGQLERALENLEHVSSKNVKAVTLAKMGVIYAKGLHKEAKSASSITQKVQASVDAPPLEVTGITGGTKPLK